jgi:hypothetical protein
VEVDELVEELELLDVDELLEELVDVEVDEETAPVQPQAMG